MNGRDLQTRASRSLLTIPLGVLLLILLLGMLRITGSSISLLDETGSYPAVAGTAREIRSDEYGTRTPMVYRQARLGFPAQTDMGVGEHDTGVLSDLPVKAISTVIKPHAWPYFVFGVERAFALEWWLVVFGPLLGVYAVVAIITRQRLISLLAGVLAAVAPSAVWDAIPSMGLSVLYGGLTATALIVACRRTGWRRLAWAVGAGWLAAAFVSMLYLPWIIPLAIVFGALVLSQFPGRVRGRNAWLVFAVTFGGVFGALMLVFFSQHHDALKSIADSVYPGDRVTSGGEANLSLVFGSPFDVFSTSRELATINGTNQSEAASGLMLWLPIAIIGGAFAGLRTRLASARALTAVLAAAVVLAAWALLPVPSKLGALFGLTRVQGWRLPLPLTVASAIAAGLYLHRVRTDGGFRPNPGSNLRATVAFGFVVGWAGTARTIDGVSPSRTSVMLLLAGVLMITYVIISGRAVVGLSCACALALFGSVRVNPLQIGFDPITKSPLLAEIDNVRGIDPNARWAVLALDPHATSIMVASGAPTVTGISWYPNLADWYAIDPTDSHVVDWNRFELVAIVPDESLTSVEYELRQADFLVIHTPTCGGALQELGVKYVTTPGEYPVSKCLRQVTAEEGAGQRWIYEVVPPPS